MLSTRYPQGAASGRRAGGAGRGGASADGVCAAKRRGRAGRESDYEHDRSGEREHGFLLRPRGSFLSPEYGVVAPECHFVC